MMDKGMVWCERCHVNPVEFVAEFYNLEDGAAFMVCLDCAREARKLGAAVVSKEVYAAV